MILHIARKSLLNRKWTFLFTLVSLMLGVALTLGINHIRAEIKNNFTKTLSGTDLVVGARSSSINLLMYSVFRLGNATNSIRWDTYQELAKHSDVKWLFPISLGDSHKGYRVVGTTTDYFTHYQYGHAQALSFAAGHEFSQVYDAVLGAEVARALGYKIGDKIAFSHGSGKVEIHHHDDKPYTVVGILESTGTPVDRSVHVSLAGIEAIHVDWHGGVSLPKKISAEDALHHDLTPTSVTAIFVGLKSRNTAFKVQRQINQYTKEPLLAIMPGAALAELWKMMSIMEDTLQLIALMVLVASLLGMTASLLATVNERRRELAILRAMGASPFYLFILIEIEILILAILGLLAGMIVLSLGLYIAQPLLIAAFGLPISANIWNAALLPYAALMVAIASFLGAIPAWMCVRNSLIGELATK